MRSGQLTTGEGQALLFTALFACAINIDHSNTLGSWIMIAIPILVMVRMAWRSIMRRSDTP